MPAASATSKKVIGLAKTLSKAVEQIDFSGAVPWVYNPLNYAWSAHEEYLKKYARKSCRFLMLGMNPGPWGMAQCGVPFGEIAFVKEYLGINAKVAKPDPEHPKRPIEGFDCARSEVSGRRLWGLMHEKYPEANDFFYEHFVANYCPLIFMEASARNVTPDKLPAAVRCELELHCDAHLAGLIEAVQPEFLIGVGAFAENCGKRVIEKAGLELQVGRILHPSPASPAANKDWAGTATKQLEQLGIW